MKVIDLTPFINEKGEISLTDQLKASMKFGLSWTAEIKAQQTIINRLQKQLEKGFTLIRNQPLGQSGITLPLVLIGPPGIYVIHATELRGMYRAKGDAWGTIDGERFLPARVNLLARTARLARALQVYLERQGLSNFGTIEPIVMAADPGLHVESVRPVVRVVMNDAVERFAASLVQARPLMSMEAVHEVVERIQHPLPPKPVQPAAEVAAQPASAPESAFRPAERETPVYQPMGVEKPFSEEPTGLTDFNASELGFAFDEEPAAPASGTAVAFRPAPPPTESMLQSRPRLTKRKGIFTPVQWAVLGGMTMATLCVFGFLAYIIFFSG